jgi:hypothetical protein
MHSDFVKQLVKFIDCYEHGWDSLDFHLHMAKREIEEELEEDSPRANPQAVTKRNKLNRRTLQRNILESINRYSAEYSQLYEEVSAEHSEDVKDVQSGKWGTIELDPQEVERFRFHRDSELNLQLELTKEFVTRIDVMAAKIQDSGEIRYRESVPEHLRLYIREAYRCDLYGFDAACAALCGAILQEAIRIKRNKRGFSGLDEAIRDASDAGLLTPRAEQAAEDVRELRNLSAHGSEMFLEAPEHRKKNSLPLTRELLDTILATES